MLKKSDLAKQFDLVVQQEIKNYQNSLDFVLQSIRELKESIEQVRSESQKSYATIHSRHSSLAIELQSLKNDFTDLNQSVLRGSNDQRAINERNTLEVRDISSALLTKISQYNSFEEKINNIWNDIHNLRSKSEKSFRVLSDNIDDLLRVFRYEMTIMKKEILDAPTEASLVKKHLEEKIVSHTVDVAGIMKELRIYKHDNMVTQKKIENIYTLIERLKKPEVLP